MFTFNSVQIYTHFAFLDLFLNRISAISGVEG